MKLTNPTDWQLNSNFAVEVAGWSWKIEGDNCVCWYDGGGRFMGGRNDGEPWDGIPKFTQSADLILPWLQSHYTKAEYWTGFAGERPTWRIEIEGIPVTKQRGSAEDKTFPRAAVIALLRAHGVEIEFT